LVGSSLVANASPGAALAEYIEAGRRELSGVTS
jgi:hypothetical protein